MKKQKGFNELLHQSQRALLMGLIGLPLCGVAAEPEIASGVNSSNESKLELVPSAFVSASVDNMSPNQSGFTVSGLLTDIDGNPVIGATVVVKGTTKGVTTDIDGRYTLKGLKAGDVIEYAYIGFNTEHKTVKRSGTINIRMVEASEMLDDVVVIGYGQQKKESVVASINSVSFKELAAPTRNLTNNIAGKIAGVLAVTRTGEPGNDDAEFWIRGISSFAGGTSPLVLVDGVPRRMNDIPTDEIETFTVLKDASATAVYGAEGANGVVLITTKRGSSAKPVLDVRTEFSMITPTRMPSMLRAIDHINLFNEAAWEAAGNPTSNWAAPYTDDIIEKYRTGYDTDLYPDTDWFGLMKDMTFNERVNLTLRGGSERVKYFVSGSFYNEDGIFDSKSVDKYDANIGLSRYNLRSNIDIDVTKSTRLSVDMSGQYVQRSGGGYNSDQIFGCIFSVAPHLIPMYYSDGRLCNVEFGFGGPVEYNPYLAMNEHGYRKSWTADLQSKVVLDQKLDFLTKGLSVKLSCSFDAIYGAGFYRSKKPRIYRARLDDDGNKIFELRNEGSPVLSDPVSTNTPAQKQIYLEAALNYKRVFNKVHDVNAMALYMQKERERQGEPLAYKKQSVVARASYAYDSRYMIESSFGMTGSENFAEGHRWGIFPSVGVAWFVSHEKFMKPFENVVNKLKLRYSYGVTGNDNIGGSRFPYRGSLNTGAPGHKFGFSGGTAGSTSNGGSGLTEMNYESPTLSWEIERKQNIGIDLGLFRGRFDMTLDYFMNKRSDILMRRKTISSIAGFRTAPFQNFGKVSNRGVDMNVVFKQNINKFNLSFRGNFTYAHNKVEEYDEIPHEYAYQDVTGRSMGLPLLYIADGLYRDADFNITEDPNNGSKIYELKEDFAKPASNVKPGDIKYRDLNKDGIINDYDRTFEHGFYGNNPEIVYGFGVQGEYKGFYAGVFFQGVGHASVNLNSYKYFMPFSNGDLSPVRSQVMGSHWSSKDPENQNVMFPRLYNGIYANNNYASTWWHRKGDFLRLKDIQFGYNFDQKFLAKLRMKHARIYVMGNNIAVWDSVKLWDPELGSNGGGAKYPLNMTWTLGLELGF